MNKRWHEQRKKRKPLLVRLFPHSPILRILFAMVLGLTAVLTAENLYHFYQIRQQEIMLTEERNRLKAENEKLAQEKEALSDPAVVEKKAREGLGMVRKGEVPYVK